MSTIALNESFPMDDATPMGDVLSSLELVIRAKSGDEDARNAICLRYLPRLRRWAHGRFPKTFDGALSTEDVVQEILFRAINNLPWFEPSHDGSFQAYVREALRNRILDECRRAGRRPLPAPIETDHPSVAPSPLEHAIGRQGVARYETALAALSSSDRAAVTMRLEWGFSYAEVARDLNLPTAGAAQMRIRRAIVRMVKDMAHEHAR